MINARMVSLALLCVLVASASTVAVPPPQPTPQTATFLVDHPGARAVLSADGIGAIFGVPLAEDSSTQTTTQQFVATFLQGNTEILGMRGVEDNELVFDDELIISNGKFAVLT